MYPMMKPGLGLELLPDFPNAAILVFGDTMEVHNMRYEPLGTAQKFLKIQSNDPIKAGNALGSH